MTGVDAEADQGRILARYIIYKRTGWSCQRTERRGRSSDRSLSSSKTKKAREKLFAEKKLLTKHNILYQVKTRYRYRQVSSCLSCWGENLTLNLSIAHARDRARWIDRPKIEITKSLVIAVSTEQKNTKYLFNQINQYFGLQHSYQVICTYKMILNSTK